MSAIPCPTCDYPAAGSTHAYPDGCIDFLRGSLAARDVALARCDDHVRGLQYQLHRAWDKAGPPWDKADQGVSR